MAVSKVFTLLLYLTWFPQRHVLHRVTWSNERQRYRDFIVSEHVLFSQEVLTLGMCSYHCMNNPDCVSFFFHTERRSCQLHSLQLPNSADWVPDKGWRYFHVNGGDIMAGATCGAGDAHSSGTPDLTFGFCEEECADSQGYIHQRHLSSCYKHYTGAEVRTVAEATLVCRAEGADLVRIDSARKQEHITDFLSYFQDDLTYIQGNDVNEEGTWVFSDGSKMSYFNWQANKAPLVDAAHAQHYIAVSKSLGFGWENVDGSGAHAYVCEKRPV